VIDVSSPTCGLYDDFHHIRQIRQTTHEFFIRHREDVYYIPTLFDHSERDGTHCLGLSTICNRLWNVVYLYNRAYSNVTATKTLIVLRSVQKITVSTHLIESSVGHHCLHIYV